MPTSAPKPTSSPKPTSKPVTTPTKTTTTTQKMTTTTSSNPHSPTQLGLAKNCDKFHRVASGDTCYTIGVKYKISIEQFRKWNPAINAECSNLWLDYYVCVHIPGATTSAAKPSPTSKGPQPQMPGIVSNCKKFHQIKSGDSCYTINKAAGITFAQFRSWNKSIDTSCSDLWLGYYVCIGV